MTRKGRRRRKHILNGLKEKTGYWKFKALESPALEEAMALSKDKLLNKWFTV
jgi:hypothetical protein